MMVDEAFNYIKPDWFSFQLYLHNMYSGTLANSFAVYIAGIILIDLSFTYVCTIVTYHAVGNL